FIHRYDPLTPLEEVLRTLDDFVSQGKVLSVGLSNYAAWQIATMLGIGKLHNLTSIHCIQPMYNITKRQVEVEMLPLALEENLAVISYSPLGGGLLTGRYGEDSKPFGRLVENKNYQVRYGGEFYKKVATEFTALAKERGVSPVSLAVAWVASNPAITAKHKACGSNERTAQIKREAHPRGASSPRDVLLKCGGMIFIHNKGFLRKPANAEPAWQGMPATGTIPAASAI
ncbi:MAG: aldo/keto reductase, partial [Clostridia bacterium]|nr:aldo/keto reductase [Clostridia bacterium]